MITKSISGGFHIYFKYDKKIIQKNGFNKDYNIDIKSDGGFIYEGEDYDLIKDTDELMKPDILIEYFNEINEVEKFEKDNRINSNLSGKEELLCNILNSIKEKFYKSYSSWIRIMMAIKNLDGDENVFYTLTENFSTENKKKTMKYQWNHYQKIEKGNKHYIGIGTILFYYKKSVEPSVFKNMKKQLQTDETDNLTEIQAYKLFCELYGDRIITIIDGRVYLCDKENNIWYEKRHNDKYLRELVEEFMDEIKNRGYSNEILDKASKRRIFIEEVLIKLQHRGEIKFNDNIYYLPFKNGVLDIRNGEIKKVEANDLIYMTTGYDYIK